ncbi:MAG: ribosomal protein S18-alanine N-acetyltransferase [Streptosporangiales bacterium]|nr:ribosomal protein S18-alanine N-acetyltransferase [Streptosporangiales bacterium]MBO0891441.1 ribosomal protein S18-alanine N-acetyltransferase [Acidothermales bacterium]
MRWWDIAPAAAMEERLFPRDAWRAESFWSELAQYDSRHYVVAERDGAVVGYAGLAAAAGEADVLTVAVDAAGQGRGVGSRLLRELLAEAERRGCADVLLEVRGDNEPALTLYERHGFERVGARRRYYADGEDAIVMRRRKARRADG